MIIEEGEYVQAKGIGNILKKKKNPNRKLSKS
jgi:hypothetical protein